MKPLVMLITIVFISQSAIADCQSSSGTFRKCYDNSNAPVALLYKMYVRNIFADSLMDQEHRTGWYYVQDGLTGKMNPVDAYLYFVPKYLEIEKEVEEVQNRMLCLDGKPRYTGAENFQIFNYMDDVQLTIYEKHLFIARSDLSVNGLFDVDKAMTGSSEGFTSMSMDHEAVRNGSIKAIFEHAQKLCAGPRGYNFISQHPVEDEPILMREN